MDEQKEVESTEIEYHVEVNFANGKDWIRNGQKHLTIESAEVMAKFFQRKWSTRIVEVKITTTVIKQSIQ